MTIENINMAVPVGREPQSSPQYDEAAAELATEAAELDALVQGLLQAMRRRDKLAWTERARHRAQNQFEVEIKGVVKRFTASIAKVVADRHSRADLRVRMYSDLLTIVKAASDDIAIRAVRRRTWRYWLCIVCGCGITGLVVFNAVLLYPRFAAG